ncbi:MAG: hypothetical protein D6690_01655 [Nitrospirae bacterium]|nr:MAG: hypothetical protein D6690_01655 [Nitrospirota bacterium]
MKKTALGTHEIRAARGVSNWLWAVAGLVDLPAVLRTDKGLDVLCAESATWCAGYFITIDYIEPGKPNQHASIERCKRSYRTGMLYVSLLNDLDEGRTII